MRIDYTYDVYGDLLTRIQYDGSLNVVATGHYGYDAWKTDSGQSSFVGLENADVWVELDGSNNLTVRRLFGNSIDNLVARIASGGTVNWYLTDRQGSVRFIVNATGTAINTVTYDGYGNATQSNSIDWYLFQGREVEITVGIMQSRDRWVILTIFRFMSNDPMGFGAGDKNLSRFGNNAPTNATDPSGKYLIIRNQDELDKWLAYLNSNGIVGYYKLLKSGRAVLWVSQQSQEDFLKLLKDRGFDAGTIDYIRGANSGDGDKNVLLEGTPDALQPILGLPLYRTWIGQSERGQANEVVENWRREYFRYMQEKYKPWLVDQHPRLWGPRGDTRTYDEKISEMTWALVDAMKRQKADELSKMCADDRAKAIAAMGNEAAVIAPFELERRRQAAAHAKAWDEWMNGTIPRQQESEAILGALMGGARGGARASRRGSNNPRINSRAKIGQEAHRQMEAEGANTWNGEQTIELPGGIKVRKDGRGIDDPNKVRIIKPDTPTGRAAAKKRAELMKSAGFDVQIDLYDPLDPRFLIGSPTYIGPKPP